MMPRQNDLLGEQKGYYTNQGRKIASNEIMGYHTIKKIEISGTLPTTIKKSPALISQG